MKSHTPLLLTLIVLSIALQYLVNATVRPLFNACVSKYKHHCMIEARRKEFYSGLSAIMNSERTPGHRG